ncbi:peptidylprolyl isomerase [Aureispira anguillae]|uniref:peptidylprolyl isomerase n=1 Tax=Aureispira anguillae TaxID=2864201 RepID=A0A915YJ67_9BACT|nr:peptidylprolyl isomerase [Aureispira anguillae]BDS14078.1 peptidylprolyl isomerase [Aureispira anguillae]
MQKIIYVLFGLGLFFAACTNSSTPPDLVIEQPRTKVSIQTQYGEMLIELFNETPKHRDNFLKLVKEGFYDSLLFHRVQPNFMIQGGDPESKGAVAPDYWLGNGNTKDRIPAELNSKFIMRQGALCGFHKGVGHQPDKSSNGSQFMIIHGQALKAYQVKEISLKNKVNYTPEQIHLYEMYGGTPQYDNTYTVFGQIIKGMNVLDKIVQAKTHRSVDPTLPDRPIEDIRMIVNIVEK